LLTDIFLSQFYALFLGVFFTQIWIRQPSIVRTSPIFFVLHCFPPFPHSPSQPLPFHSCGSSNSCFPMMRCSACSKPIRGRNSHFPVPPRNCSHSILVAQATAVFQDPSALMNCLSCVQGNAYLSCCRPTAMVCPLPVFYLIPSYVHFFWCNNPDRTSVSRPVAGKEGSPGPSRPPCSSHGVN